MRTTKNIIKQIVREEYVKLISELSDSNEEQQPQQTTHGKAQMNKIAFDIATKLVQLVDSKSMEARINAKSLLALVIDQAKIQIKE